jgi:protein-S-isoprenylcysteine O-methyltransferase Ste14
LSLFLIISIVWVAFEVFLSRKKRSNGTGIKDDRSSLTVLWITLILAISAGIYISRFDIGTIELYSSFIHYFGLFLIICGLIIRWIAILKLKDLFSVTVFVQENHQLVDSGIYKHIRHPAYLGSLISFLGLGFAWQNWLSLFIIFIPIFTALSYRIHVEEKVLFREFGDEYSRYISQTKKLLPWIY